MVPNLGASSGVHQQGNTGESRPGSVAGASNTSSEMETGRKTPEEKSDVVPENEGKLVAAMSDYQAAGPSRAISTSPQVAEQNQSSDSESWNALSYEYKVGHKNGYQNGFLDAHQKEYPESSKEDVKKAFNLAFYPAFDAEFQKCFLLGRQDGYEVRRTESLDSAFGGQSECEFRSLSKSKKGYENAEGSGSTSPYTPFERKEYSKGYADGFEEGSLDGCCDGRENGTKQGTKYGGKEGYKAGYVSKWESL